VKYSRAIVLAVCLFFGGWRLKATDADYLVKVVETDKASGYVVARFVSVPDDLRILCKGTDISKIFTSDFIKLTVNKDHLFAIKGTDAVCSSIVWFR
jgi:hypothetical protein